MNYKLLFPTYRNRFLFVRNNLKALSVNHEFTDALNLGTGEGDYDQMIASYCDNLTACDINEADIAYAKQLNQGVKNLEYRVEDALNLSFADNRFDLIISVDVIEHVGRPARMIEEVYRVLKPGGIAMITFPSLKFPFTYDPINRILSLFGDQKISQGAYAFGHEYLIDPMEFKKWVSSHGMKVSKEKNLSGYLVALLEMYWTGIIQRIFKSNASNLSEGKESKAALRPSVKEPALTAVTDTIIKIDDKIFALASHSVGKGFIIHKQ